MVRKTIVALCAALACFLLGWQTGRLVDGGPAELVVAADRLLNQVKLPETAVVQKMSTPTKQPAPEVEKQELPQPRTAARQEPALEKSIPARTTSRAKAKAGPQVVNINQAGVEELESLPGIGPALARRIVDYRQQYGPFTDKEQLLAVPGIGAKKMAELRPWIRI